MEVSKIGMLVLLCCCVVFERQERQLFPSSDLSLLFQPFIIPSFSIPKENHYLKNTPLGWPKLPPHPNGLQCLAFLIDFIIKLVILIMTMQPSTPISSYKHTQQESPPVPNILRSRHKISLPEDDPLRKIREFVHLPHEIIIDARKYNQEHPSHRDRGNAVQQEGIRSEIDACLSAVAKVYEEQHKRRGSRLLPNEVKMDNSDPVISANSIHRVDTNLILKYIGTISQDYGIPNRFDNLRGSILSNNRTQTIRPLAKNTEERFTSTQKTRGKSRKSFINMTLSTTRQKREDSTSKPQVNSQTNHRFSPSTNHTPNRTDVRTNHPTSATKPLNQSQIKIHEEFKYCISCEKSILVKNIEYHERYECRQLEGIYRMTFHELRDFINGKINRMRKEVQDNIVRLRQMQSNHTSEFPQVDLKGELCENVVKSIENYLKSLSFEQASGNDQIHENYSIFLNTLKNEFFHCINLTHKLDYFLKISQNINDQLALPLSLSHQNSCESILKNTPPLRMDPSKLSHEGRERGMEEGYRVSVKPVSDFEQGQ